jgi:hypothetical protein
MPDGININGQLIRTPGVYFDVDYSANDGVTGLFKTLGVIGDFPFLPPYVPVQLTSKADFDALNPGDLEMKRLSGIIFNPAADDRIAGGPTDIFLCSTQPSTQASLTMVDALGNDVVTLKATTYGPKGNQTLVAVTVDTGVYTVELSRAGVSEEYTNIEGLNLFTLQLDGGSPWTTALATFVQNGNFSVAVTRELNAAQTVGSLSEPFNSKVSVLPSGAAGLGVTFTATVIGVDDVGDAQTDTLTWTDEAASTKQTAHTFATITSIAYAVTAGTTTAMFSGKAFDGDSTDFSTAKALADYIDGFANYIVGGISDEGASVGLDEMDPVTSVTIVGGALQFQRLASAFVDALANSALVTATLVEGGGPPVAVTGYLTGGTKTASADGDWDSALTGMQLAPARVLVPMSESAAIHAKVSAHAKLMAGGGANECNAWVGSATLETKAQLKTRRTNLNTRHVSLVGQDCKAYGPLGKAEWTSPMYTALRLAAAQCAVGVAVPLTSKFLNILGVRQNSGWSPVTTREEMIQNGLTFIAQTTDGFSVVRALTTFKTTDDPARTEVSANESVYQFCLFMRAGLIARIGNPITNNVPAIIKSAVKSLAQEAKDGGLIQDFNGDSITLDQVGDLVNIGIDIDSVYPLNFLGLKVRIRRQTVKLTSFQLALAA